MTKYNLEDNDLPNKAIAASKSMKVPLENLLVQLVMPGAPPETTGNFKIL
jgi:hypothetical protein